MKLALISWKAPGVAIVTDRPVILFLTGALRGSDPSLDPLNERIALISAIESPRFCNIPGHWPTYHS
jgi:hypothetical protein